MIEPKPLFDDEEPEGAAAPPASVGRQVDLAPLIFPEEPPPPSPASGGRSYAAPLDLPDEPEPAARPPVIRVAPALAGAEHPFVAAAMTRGERLFPDIMKESGFQVRNELADLIPVDFEKIAAFAADSLQRAAHLVGQIEGLNEAFHRLDAEAIITGIVERARDHAANARRSVAGLLASLIPFDEHLARSQIETIRQAIATERATLGKTADSISRLSRTLAVKGAVLAILDDMGDRGAAGDLLSRRLALLTAAKQELDIAARQIGNLETLAEQWVMRCDEVSAVTLPALGMSGRLR